MEDRPNILLIVADGMQERTIASDHPCQTPHLEQLMARGVRIRNAYTPLPTCSPARASLMTGLLPHNHGVLEVERDPHELHNLAGCPEYVDRARHLMTQLWREATKSGDSTIVNTHYHSMRFGVVGPEAAHD